MAETHVSQECDRSWTVNVPADVTLSGMADFDEVRDSDMLVIESNFEKLERLSKR